MAGLVRLPLSRRVTERLLLLLVLLARTGFWLLLKRPPLLMARLLLSALTLRDIRCALEEERPRWRPTLTSASSRCM